MSQVEPAIDLVTRWRGGDESAATELYLRYAARLCRLAGKRLSPRFQHRFDEDDVVQSAFRTFFRRTAEGQYSIDSSGSLWALLAKITVRKVHKHIERNPHVDKEINVTTLPDPPVGEPPPDEAVIFVEQIESLFDGLSPKHAEILQLCLEGYSTSEIEERVGRRRWTIRRVLNRVGEQLCAIAEAESEG